MSYLKEWGIGSWGGYSPIKVTGGVLVGKFREHTPLKGSRILLYGRVPNSFPPLRGTNSTTTNNITGTAKFNSNKDNFRTLSSQGHFKSIAINLYPPRSVSTLAAVILGFRNPSGTIHKFKPLKGTTSTPVTFIGEKPPPGGRYMCSTRFISWAKRRKTLAKRPITILPPI